MPSNANGPEPPCLSTDQMREVDRAMVEDYGILLIQMMENAGRNLAHLARERFLEGNASGKTILVLAGPGGNGGGGLVCARRLHNWGADVRVYLSSPVATLTEVPRHQHDVLKKIRSRRRAPPHRHRRTAPAVFTPAAEPGGGAAVRDAGDHEDRLDDAPPVAHTQLSAGGFRWNIQCTLSWKLATNSRTLSCRTRPVRCANCRIS